MKLLRGLFFISLSLLLIIISGCDYTLSSFKRLKYVEWISEDSSIYFRTLDSHGDGFGYVTINEKQESAYFYPGLQSQLVIKLFKETPLGDHTVKDICNFTVNYKNGFLKSYDKSVDIFGTVYSPFSLEKREVNRDTIDAAEYMYTDWNGPNNILSFSIWQFSDKAGEGIARVGGTEKEIVFIWCKEKSFKIYLGRYYSDDRIQNDDLVAYGTYTNNQKEAVLTFANDELFNFGCPYSITINGKSR